MHDIRQEVTPLPKRHSIRMPGYDYASNAKYFVTICCAERNNGLGIVVPSEGDTDGWCVRHNALGRVVVEEINKIPARFRDDVTVDGFIVMPDHIHAMISINKEGHCRLAVIIGGLKSIVSNRHLRMCKQTGQSYEPVWQRNYYEHIVRDREEFNNILRYMYENPKRWAAKHNLADVG